MASLEIWGGLECTLNRVQDSYMDQCRKNGHYERPSDFELFGQIGIKKIRYPCLWETVAKTNRYERDWSLIDQQLNVLKKLDLKPIAGFLHHGSGPAYTSLIDPEFPEMFAEYSGDFAARYPWIDEFTPVKHQNFSGKNCSSHVGQLYFRSGRSI
jgi:dTDP-4-dehydrorhamnose reductase